MNQEEKLKQLIEEKTKIVEEKATQLEKGQEL